MPDDLRTRILDAALDHVPFDGWSDETLQAAAADAGVDVADVKQLYPRGAVDLAVAFHKRGDDQMLAAMDAVDLSDLRYSARVAAGVRFRLEAITDKEIVRRGLTLFAQPNHAGDGAQLVWGTADAIWTRLGDTSDDVNWYSKRAILSAVYGSTLLFWLGDVSDDHAATWQFLDRRIEDVMRFEKLKSKAKESAALRPLLAIPNALFAGIKAPTANRRSDLPGHWSGPVKGRL